MNQKTLTALVVTIAACALAGRSAAQTVTDTRLLPPHQRWGGPPVSVAQEPELPRGTLDVRLEEAATWTATEAPTFVNIPKMSASFVAAEDDTNLAVVFSAEASTNVTQKRVFVRALIDGAVADPSDVVFTEGGFGGARSFIFTGVVDAGVHTVEMQWLVDAGAEASLRAASLMLRHGVGGPAGGTVTHHTPPSGQDLATTVPSWIPIPGTSVPFWLPENARPIVSFSAETHVSGANKRMFVRARIDGAVLSPGDVVFAQRASRQTHTMRFEGTAMPAGWYTATIEWQVDAGGVATVGDRTLLVTAFPQTSRFRHDLVVAPSGPSVSTSSGAWSQVPDLSALVPLPDNAEIAASFSGEVHGPHGASLEMRLMANGVAIASETATLTGSGFPFETGSFTFDRKHVFLPPNTLTGIWLEWRAVGGEVFMGDRVLELVVEKGLVPDLAEAPPIGLGNGRVEAAIGTRKLLTIIHRIPRAAPNHVIPSAAAVTDALYGATGVADYYDKVSGGRFTFQNAGVLSVNALQTEDHYWNHGPFGCGMPLQDGYAGGHAERWAESIAQASLLFDFASHDADQNGIVEPDELAILIVVPQAAEDGFTRALDPFCSGLPFMTDGVVIPAISEVFTSSPASSWEVMAHELAHLVLDLGDMYANNFNFDTEVGPLSLMGNNFGTSSHVDAVTKLALGWATPVYAPFDAMYALQDVKETGRVLVLPRDLDGDGKEFFALEVRRAISGSPLYDTGIGANGIVVWHAVEEPSQNANPPACESVADWNNVSSNARRGVRVVRPGIVYAGGSASIWNSFDYDLLDTGLSCSAPVRNALLWADGEPGGFGIRDFSASGQVMTFEIETP